MFVAGTEVQVIELLSQEVESKGGVTRYTIAGVKIIVGDYKLQKFFCNAEEVVRILLFDVNFGTVPSTDAGRPKKRRYASQEAQRQLNMQMINQIGQAAIEQDTLRREALYRSTTPDHRSPSGSSHYCGVPTSTTEAPCRRLVIGPGYCYQHR